MGKTSKPAVVDKEEAKMRAASEAAAKRSSKKAMKGHMKMYIVGAAGGAVCLLALVLAASGPAPKKGAPTKYDADVNDRSTVSDVTAKAEGNFTAAASPFFNKWTLADVKYGHSGIFVSNMVGMPGAVQVCEGEEGLEGGALPPSYDARDNWPGCFPDVVDSGNCSSSYAIASTESLASRFCIGDNAKYPSLKLSAQQILSCDKKSRGCAGGGVDTVWAYMQKRGLFPEECVPYVGQKGAACSKSMTTCDDSKKVKVLDHCVLTKVKAIKREIYNRGPVVAPIYLRKEYLVYSSGVYSPIESTEQLFEQNGDPVMHAVSVLGWGKSQGTPYWLVRHSWGTSWGESGYARVAMESVLREGYVVVGVAATEEALQAAELKKQEEAQKKEEAKKERALRDERIRENRARMAAEQAAAKEAADMKEMDDEDDFEAEVDLDADDDISLEGDGPKKEEKKDDIDADIED
jgi:hypothetical protein